MNKLSNVLLTLLLSAMISPSVFATQHTVFLIRHAEKEKSESKDPPLSEAGIARAKRLADNLLPAKLTHIFSTQYQRTKQTAEIVASANHSQLFSVEVNAQNSASYAQQIKQSICELPNNSVILVVGHSNSIPAMVSEWTNTPMTEIADNEFDRLYMLQLKNCVAGEYGLMRY